MKLIIFNRGLVGLDPSILFTRIKHSLSVKKLAVVFKLSAGATLQMRRIERLLLYKTTKKEKKKA